MKNWRGWVLPAIVVVASELLIRQTVTDSDVLVPPSKIAAASVVAMADGSLLHATFETLAAAAGGLALGGGFGLALGILLGISRSAFEVSFLADFVWRSLSWRLRPYGRS